MRPFHNAVYAPVRLLVLFWVVLPGLVAVSGGEELECRKVASAFEAVDSSARKYAPSREVMMRHLALEVTPDFQKQTIQAKAVLTLKIAAGPVAEIKLDAVDLNVRSVEVSAPVADYQVTEEQIIISFEKPLPPDSQISVTINYTAEPKRGLYFRTPEMGYRPGDTHLFTQGEEIEARHWYPCLDAPNQLLTSEITCRVPAGMTVISNGRLVEESQDAGSGLKRVRWSQEKPHANYLVSLVAGQFGRIEGECQGIPLAFYTPPSEIQQASNSFRHTADMIRFFEQETGVAYPWAKYYQVCVNDFVAGGMENTSATTLADRTLFTAATETIRNSEGLVAHELAHQWFGNLVTCKDWSHIWLNEGFATYYQSLWTAHHRGRDEMLYGLYYRARQILGGTNDSTPMVRRTYDDPGEMFNHLAYGKGGWVLHMLRAQLGEDLFRRGIKLYLERHRHGNVETDHLRAALEEVSGQGLDRFFDQWVYHGGFPQLQAEYSWDQGAKMARVFIRQIQPVNERSMLFEFPLRVRLVGKFGTSDQVVEVTKREEGFYFPLPGRPELVRLDPDYALLAKITLDLPRSMLYTQLGEQADLVGRLTALAQLSKRGDKETVQRIKNVLETDKFYGVRIEAAKALAGMRTPEAREILLGALQQTDPRVRQRVLESLAGFYHPEVCDRVRAMIRSERNPAVVSAGLQVLAAYSGTDIRDTLLEFLNSVSYRNELAEGAIDAIRLQGDPAFIGLLLETLARRGAELETPALCKGLETLGFLARNESDKSNVREYLIRHVNHPRSRVRVASLRALGDLGDDQAIPLLQGFAGQVRDNAEKKAATSALKDLHAGRKPGEELSSLRQTVLDLQKANQDLQRQVEDLGKKVSRGTAGRSRTGSR
ncbi:MAG TPA: M1 family metallopeptidase [Clostridia bacterium]|nr:M1 family metallopeptidase [Clostridia bacterium]